jgi:hypothetical protein
MQYSSEQIMQVAPCRGLLSSSSQLQGTRTLWLTNLV